MAEDNSDEKSVTKQVKHRSPNYPFIGLEEALHRLGQINDVGRGHFIPIGTARSTWGYKRNAGDRTAAALKAYGLIEVRGSSEKRELKPTEVGVKILEGHSQKLELIKQAALSPDIHKELWEKYGGKLPADMVVKEFLRWEKNFNPENVDKFLQQFHDTITFANLGESDKSTPEETSREHALHPAGGRSAVQAPHQLTHTLQNPPQSPPITTSWDDLSGSTGGEVLSFSLSRTGKAQVKFNGQITQEAVRKLIALLDLSVDTYPTQAELAQPKRAMWHNKDHDLPVTVTGEAGERDGKKFFSITESDTGIPEDELEFEE